MVFKTDTYELCHALADCAKDTYSRILEDAADDILLKHKHPIKWIFKHIIDKIQDFKNQVS